MKSPKTPSCFRLPSGRRLLGLAVLGLGWFGSASFARAQIYSQDFSGGSAPGWVVAGGTWSVSGGVYTETSNTGGPNVSYYGGEKFDTGVTYTSSLRMWGTGSGNDTGVVYYYQDSSNYYEVELNGYTNTVHLIEHVNSAAGTTVASASFTSSGGTYQTVAVGRSGSTTTISINGAAVITRSETGLTGGGYIGAADRWATERITDISVADVQPPSVTITAPADQSQVSGTVAVSANASDNIGVASVQFQLDGANLGSAVTAAPYTIEWNTAAASNAQHVLTAIATDTSGNTATSSGVLATVNNLPAGWTNQDIGAPAVPGGASYSSGTFTLSGAGTGAWGTSDQFQFAWQQVTGDCTIIAKVDSVEAVGAGGFEHGGIMIRDSLDADSSYAGAYETAGKGAFFEARTSGGGSAVDSGSGTDQPTPYWLQLTRSGDTFTAYSSTDGLTWNMLGSPITISMASTVYIGLAASSEVAGAATTAVYEGVSLSNGLPEGWSTSDIGSVGAPGNAGYDNGIYTVSGAGIGPWATSDTFRYVYQQVTGDCIVVAKVDSVQSVGAAGWEHGGVMIRESLDPSSAFAGAYETATRGLLFEARTSTGGSAAGYGADSTHLTPYWVKLARSGNTFTVYSSPDGYTWTQLGSQLTIDMAPTVYVGLAVASEVSGGATPTAAVFQDLSLATPPTVAITSPTDQSQVAGTISVSADASGNAGVASVQFQLDGANLGAPVTTAPYNVAWDTTTASNGQHVLTAIATDTANNQAMSAAVAVTVDNSGLPTGWSSQDIGGPGAPGSTSYSGGTFTVNGAGTGIFNTSDEFQFAYEQMTGDCTVIARVVSVQSVGASGWEHGGVMIRNTLDADSAYAGAYETSSRGLLFESRASAGASATGDGADASEGCPYWVKLVRSGDVFTAYSSPDGSAWTELGAAQTISMNATVYVGLAVSSQVDSTTATAVFDNVSISNMGGGGEYKTTFPRLGGIFYNSADYSDASYQQAIAKFDLGDLGFYKGWGSGSGWTIPEAVNAIKGYNPAIILGNYTVIESQYTKATGATADAYDELTSQVGPQGNGGTWTPNDWWAHTTTGATVEEPGYSTTDVVNITAFTTPNSDGDRYPQWYAKWVDNWCFSVAPFDFVYCDNAFDGPRYDGAPIDWNRDGVADSETDPTVMAYWRAGMASYWTEIYALMPGMQIMANAGGSYLEATGNLRYPEYQYKVGMALDEGFMGVSYSEETWSGWYNAMGSYGQLEANTAAPNIVLLRCAMTADGMCADTSTQSEYGGGASYAFMRYALASTLMGNGYFEADPNDYSQNPPLWFDEFDLAGTATTGWLGAAIDPPQTTPYQNGVFLRRFENGLAIVNPRTNPDLSVRTAETITLPSGYKHFLGKQDPVTNNGQPVTSITIQAGDGVLLETQ